MTLFFFDKNTASISGRLVEDSNRDFTEIAADGGFEIGFAGVQVQLLNAAGHVIATTTTDGSGRYTFDNLASGTYSIRVPTAINGNTLAQKDVGGSGVDSDANANGVTDPIYLGKGERLNEVDVVYGQYPDGNVDGAETGELMGVGYSDTQGDLITEGADVIFGNGGNDDIRAAGGNDSVSGGAGNDTIDGGTGDDLISGNGGNDTITGGTGNDTLFGDNSIDPTAGTFTGPRESFEWDLLSQSQADSSAVQDTGVVTVTYTRTADTGSHESDVDTHTYLNVAGIDDGTETIDTTSSLSSQTNGNGNLGAFQWQFSDPVGNLEFNINDLDGDGRVTIRAFDANGNEVPVILNAGSDVTISGNTATAVGPYQQPNDPDTTVQVTIPGPVSRVTLEHTQVGHDNSGINITDMYFDTGFVPFSDTSDSGNDVIDGGEGADQIFGNGGDDTITGGTGNDTIFGDNGPDVGPPAPTVISSVPVPGAAHTFIVWELSDATFVNAPGNGNPFANDSVGEDDVNGSTFTINPGATPTTVGINDNDSRFEDGDNGQQLVQPVTLNGKFVAAGEELEIEYSYSVQDSAGNIINIYAVEEDSDDVFGFISDLPLVVGETYTFIGRTSTDPEIPYDNIATTYLIPSTPAAPGGGSGDGIGDDLIDGGTGDDAIVGGGGNDTITGGTGNDTIFGDFGIELSGTPDLNQIVNGSFEDVSGLTSTFYGFVGTGAIPGWTTADPNDEIDVHNDSRDGQVATDGANWLDLEASPGNIRIGQDVQGLVAGEAYQLTFDVSDGGSLPFDGPDENLLNVYWGGQLVATIDPSNVNESNFETITLNLVAGAGNGSDRLEFEGTGREDNLGVAVDNVSLVPTTDAGIAAALEGRRTGDDLIDGGTGDDAIAGGGGNDTITGGAGADQMQGGSGDDVFVVGSPTDGAGDVIIGGNGPDDATDNDILDLTGAGPVTISLSDDATAEGASTGTVTFSNGAVLNFSQIETIITDPVDLAPVATDDVAVVDEDGVVTIDVLANDSDPNGDALTITAATVPPAQGTVDIVGNQLVFTPAPDFNGDATISYTVADPAGNTDTGSVAVTVTPVNDAPDAVNDTATTDEEAPITIDVLGNDTDVDGDPLTITAASVPTAQGTVDIVGNQLVFTPAEDFFGPATISYAISDGNGGTDVAEVTVDVRNVNDAPVATDDIATTDEDVAVVVDLLGNDSDVDGDPLSIGTVSVDPAQGSVVDNGDGTVTFTPAPNFNGPATITYTVIDGQGGADTGTATVNVSSVIDPPNAVNDTATTDEDTPVTIDVLANDSDPDNQALTITAASVPAAQGTVDIVGNQLVFTPAENFNGEATITYSIVDTDGATDTATVAVTVTPVNDAPVALDDIATTDEDVAIIVDLLGNDSDVDGDPLRIGTVSVDPAQGSVVDNGDGTVTFTPAPDFNGPATITYTVVDDAGGEDTGTATVNVGAVNDAPIAENDTATTDEDTPVTIDVLANDSDPENDPLTIIAASVPAAQGDVDVAGNQLVFTPAENFTGTATISYTVSDGNGLTDTATVAVDVGGVNDAPDAVNDTAETPFETPVTIDVLANDSDPENDPLTVTLASVSPTQGTVAIVGNQLVFTPADGLSGPATISYTLSDGSLIDTAEVIVTVGADPFPSDGVVDGEETGEVMAPGYDDSNAPTDGGGDVIGAGDDVIDGAGGDDTIDAGLGNDTVDGGIGDDVIDGGAGDDLLAGGLGDDAIEGGDGADDILGGDGADTLVGGAGVDTLDGGDGDDLIAVGGADQATGGDGDDVFTLDPTDPAADVDVALDGGADGTDGAPAGPENGDAGDILDLSDQPGDLTVVLGPNPETGTVDGLDADATPDIAFDEIEKVLTGTGDDTIDGGDATTPIDVDTGAGDDDVTGGAGDDTIAAGPGDDTVDAGAGDDSVTGGAGDDVIDGGAGDDVLDGGDDDDSIDGGDGADSLTGGEGSDTLAGGEGPDTLDGGAGDDDLLAGAGDLAEGGAGDDEFRIDPTLSGTDPITIIGGETDEEAVIDPTNNPLGRIGDTLDLSGLDVVSVTFDPTDPTFDPVTGVGESGTVVFNNAAGDPVTINFSEIENVIFDPLPDGVVDGEETGEVMAPGYNDDNAPTDGGGDIIDGPDGLNDSIRGNGGDDTINAGNGNDTVDGGIGDDFVLGGFGDDELAGGEGNDSLFGGTGNDTLDGGAGDDLLVSGSFDGTQPVGAPTSNDGPGNANLVNGGEGNDTILASVGPDTLNGDAGDDSIIGNAGDDVISGGTGVDTLEGEEGADTILGGAGDDVIEGGDGDDITYGDDAQGFGTLSVPDQIGDQDGAGGDDLFIGGLGADQSWGEGGNDTLAVGSAANGAGDIFVAGNGPDDTTDNDVLDLRGAGPVVIDATPDATDDGAQSGTVTFADGSVLTFFQVETILVDPDGVVDGLDTGEVMDPGYTDAQGDEIDGADGLDDVIDGNGGDDTIDAGLGNDTVDGGIGDDVIDGGAGDDVLDGGAGDDTLDGGTGNDSITDLDGNNLINAGDDGLPDLGFPFVGNADPNPDDDRDTVTTGAGDDTINTGHDADVIDAGDGNNVIDAGFDADEITSGAGDDSITSGEGSDTVQAGAGNDTIFGGVGPVLGGVVNLIDDNVVPLRDDPILDNGDDLIDAGEGDDLVFGEDDNDTILGGAGNDTLDGGIDDDVIEGGAGNDVIIGGQGADLLDGGLGNDSFTIGDFTDPIYGDTYKEGLGDTIIGGEDPDGNDIDVLDLSAAGPLSIAYDSTDPTFDPATGVGESGTVTFFTDATQTTVAGTLTFAEIENVIPCFTPGTLIATPKGEVPVESLREGDRVITRDNGIQEIRWIGNRTLNRDELAANPSLKPILIKAGSLGHGLPERDMVVSPQHRLLIAGDRTQLYFDESEVLVAAKHLVNNMAIQTLETLRTTYIHFMFDRHEVVLSDGAWTESFQPGDQTLGAMGQAARDEIVALFPELATAEGVADYAAARRALKAHEAKLLQL